MIEATLTMRPAPSAIIARTTYLVSTMGESVLTRTSSSICELCIVASTPSCPSAALLTRPNSGPNSLRRPRTKSGISSILPRSKGAKCSAPCLLAFDFRDRRGHLLALLARHGDDAIAGGGELSRDAEAEAAAAAGHENAAHRLRRMTLLTLAARQLAGRGDRQRRHEADRGRNLVARQRLAAKLEDIAP